MRAMVLPAYGAPLEELELADPEPPTGGAVVRVRAAGVCHSDLHLVDGAPAMVPAFPWVLGHEICGEVAALGDGARGVRVGDEVAVFGGWGCGRCALCAAGEEQLCNLGGWVGIGVPGGYAEYVAVPAVRHLLPLHGLDPVAAVPLTDAGLTPYRAVSKALARLTPGSVVVSIGAGGLGQYAVQYVLLRSQARLVVVDTDASKLAAARRLGATDTVDPQEAEALPRLSELAGPYGASAVLDFVGSAETLALAASVVGKAGLVVVVGLGGGSLPFSFLGLAPEATVTTSYWGDRSELEEVLRLARDGELLTPHSTYSLKDANHALEDLRSGRVAGRAVLVP